MKMDFFFFCKEGGGVMLRLSRKFDWSIIRKNWEILFKSTTLLI